MHRGFRDPNTIIPATTAHGREPGESRAHTRKRKLLGLQTQQNAHAIFQRTVAAAVRFARGPF